MSDGRSTVDLRVRRERGYETPRPDIAAHVPRTVRNILEFGCSVGTLGASIKRRQEAHVVGVELAPDYAREAESVLDRVVNSTVEDFLADGRPPEAPFDCLIAADVLEHLLDPWGALGAAADLLAEGAVVIVSLPNVLYWRVLLRVLRERRWPRDDEGLFDRTHLRWFSRLDAEDLVRQAGLTIRHVEPRYWREGAALARIERLAATPLAPYLPAQHIVVAVKR
jgi:2-polyprenyl-3-methyl-5-hydroxy-6-metoxy-1,4-benzoquinol methylase